MLRLRQYEILTRSLRKPPEPLDEEGFFYITDRLKDKIDDFI
ncbi:MAG: hypothetical protein AAFW70_04885 [Cyanobacteria bacterium J06635_10]